MRSIILAATLALCSLTASAQTAGDYPDALDVQLTKPNPLPLMWEGEPPEQVLYARIREMAFDRFQEAQFRSLEEMAVSYRNPDAATPSGARLLNVFYDAFLPPTDTDESVFELALEQARDYRNTFPDSPTPLVIEAQILYAHAWKARGHEYGHKVARQQWNVFYERLTQAQELLTTNGALTVKDPHGLATLVRIAVHLHDPAGYERVLQYAIDHEPNYATIYASAAEAYSPKYQRDPEALNALAERALVAGGDKGLENVARLYVHAWLDYGRDLVEATGLDRTLLREAVFSALKSHPDRYNFELFGMMACDIRDWEMAAPIFHRLQVLPTENYFWEGDPSYQGCRSDLYYERTRS